MTDGSLPAAARRLRLGTSSFSEKDWVGPFYPPGTRPDRFIEHYATVFDTVEVDATFYRMPTARQVAAWTARTPEGFTFALKTPRLITHEKVLQDADDDMAHFVEVIQALGDRLGPVLLQFPYFNKSVFSTADGFLTRLDRFLARLPARVRFAVEVRNRAWVKPPLQQLCRDHRVALAWVCQAWMPDAGEWPRLTGGPSTDFSYLRFLGDHKEIEQITSSWGRTVVDRSAVLRAWVPVVRDLFAQDVAVHGYFNNHFAGHAPDSLRLFRALLAE